MLPGPEETKAKLDQKAKQKAIQRVIETEKVELTEKEARFVQVAHAHPEWSQTHIAREAGYSISSRSRASHIVQQIQGKLGPIFDTVFGINEYNICKALAEALDATDKRPVVIHEYNTDGKVVREKIEVFEQPNWQARLHAVRALIKLGAYDPAAKLQIEVEDKNKTRFCDMMEDRAKQLAEREQELSKQVEADYELVN